MSPRTNRDRLDVRYRNTQEFTINLEPHVLGEFERGALNIEVLGHQDRYRAREKREEAGIDWGAVEEEGRSLAERWSDVSRRVKLDVEIQELDDGNYQPVEIEKLGTSCGGIFQLRAGMSRRVLISTTPQIERGQLPLVLGEIHAAQIGSILVDGDNYSEIKTPDSYQEHDLANLREKWSSALDERKALLDSELQKEQIDVDRESALFQQVAILAEERNSVLVPQAESGMPGAPEPDDGAVAPGAEVTFQICL
jgi:kinesin family protein 13